MFARLYAFTCMYSMCVLACPCSSPECVHSYACMCVFVCPSVCVCVVSMCVPKETRSCICGGANLHHSCSDMYVLGQGGVKGVSEHLEDFLHGFGMFCSRTPSCCQSCLLEKQWDKVEERQYIGSFALTIRLSIRCCQIWFIFIKTSMDAPGSLTQLESLHHVV